MPHIDPQRTAMLAADAARLVELIAGNIEATMRVPGYLGPASPDLAGPARALAAEAAAAATHATRALTSVDPTGSPASPPTLLRRATRHLKTIEHDLDSVTIIYRTRMRSTSRPHRARRRARSDARIARQPATLLQPVRRHPGRTHQRRLTTPIAPSARERARASTPSRNIGTPPGQMQETAGETRAHGCSPPPNLGHSGHRHNASQ